VITHYSKQPRLALASLMLVGASLLLLGACGSISDEVVVPVDSGATMSVGTVVHTDKSIITLLDPADLTHHQSEPPNWYLHDFAINDDLQSGRFAAVLTGRTGKFNVRVTFGELTPTESKAAGPEAKLRLRVVNHRLLLSGGDTWPSKEVDYKQFANDARWISVPNGDYGVIITALKPGAAHSDYVFQLIRVKDMTKVKHAPGMPKLVYGEKAAVVGVNARGFQYNEQCLDVPTSATWVPLAARTMPIPGAREAIELPKSVHTWAYNQQQAGNVATIPLVLSRSPEVGDYGFYIKPRSWSREQIQPNGDVIIDTLIRCAVEIIGVVANPQDFSLKLKPVPTASDNVSRRKKQRLMDGLDAWLRAKNDPAWLFKRAKVERSTSDGAMILGILEYLKLSSKETEKLLPMSNALRVDYLLDRFK